MAALSALTTPGAANLVWQKVKIHLAGASPAAQAAFKGLREYLVTQERNPDLVLTTFSQAQLVTANDGLGVGAGTAKIYGLYFKKGNDATDAFVSVVDDGTDDNYYGGSLTGSVRLQIAALLANDEAVFISPTGLDMANGIRLVSTTTAAGGTTVSADAADTVDGFLIYGRA